jgi:hypothetical protein
MPGRWEEEWLSWWWWLPRVRERERDRESDFERDLWCLWCLWCLEWELRPPPETIEAASSRSPMVLGEIYLCWGRDGGCVSRAEAARDGAGEFLTRRSGLELASFAMSQLDRQFSKLTARKAEAGVWPGSSGKRTWGAFLASAFWFQSAQPN